MHKLVIDTSVWLDLARDIRTGPVVSALRTLLDELEVQIVIPDIVHQEFNRNIERKRAENLKLMTAQITNTRHVLKSQPGDATIAAVLAAFDSIEFVASVSTAANRHTESVKSLFDSIKNRIVSSDEALLARAAQRGIAKLAPCHHSNKNSVADAVIFEYYMRLVAAREEGDSIAFVTSNTSDFSSQHGDKRKPHEDLADTIGPASEYVIDIAAHLNEQWQGFFESLSVEADTYITPRTLPEIVQAEHELSSQTWYHRHLARVRKVESGEIKVLTIEHYSFRPRRRSQILDTTWEKMKNTAEEVRAELGEENLGPWNDYEIGVIHGKLSALRWILGDDWEELD